MRPGSPTVSVVALLRGVNVGGRNRLPMAELVAVCQAAGGRHVRTFIQSGNAVLEVDPAAVDGLPARLARLLAERAGLEVPVVVRTSLELAAVVARNPFAARGTAPEQLHCAFLADRPAPGRVAALDPDRSPPDRLEVVGREVYLWLPDGVARSRLTADYLDRTLGTTSTARSWRTVVALEAMARG